MEGRNIDRYIVHKTFQYEIRNFTSNYTFIVSGEIIKCNREMITSCSEYFRHRILNSNVEWGESSKNVMKINDTEIHIFQLIIAYIYDCEINFAAIKFDVLSELLEKSHLYELQDLTILLESVLIHHLTPTNIHKITVYASKYGLERLCDLCLQFIYTNAHDLLNSEFFLEPMTHDQMVFLLKYQGHELYIDEINVFHSVQKWFNLHPSFSDKKNFYISCVRLNLITQEEFDQIIQPSGAFTKQEYENFRMAMNENERRRKPRIPDTNFSLEANVTQGNHWVSRYLERTDKAVNDKQAYCAYTELGEVNGIILDLGSVKLINNMRLHLNDAKNPITNSYNSFSYYVEVSTNEENWFMVCDHRSAICRSIQNIYFYPKEVRFIKIVGTNVFDDLSPSEEYRLCIKTFTCQLVSHKFKLIDKIWAPNSNLATINRGSIVLDGDDVPPNPGTKGWILYENSPSDGFTCHMIDNINYISVHLPQPISHKFIKIDLVDGLNNYELTAAGFIKNSELSFVPIITLGDDIWHNDGKTYCFTSVIRIKAPLGHQMKCKKLHCPFYQSSAQNQARGSSLSSGFLSRLGLSSLRGWISF